MKKLILLALVIFFFAMAVPVLAQQVGNVWVSRFHAGDDRAHAMVVDGSGNVYVTGGSTGSETRYDCATIKYSPEGDAAWVRRYNGPGNGRDEATAIAIDNSGNVYVTGWSQGSGTDEEYVTIKYEQSIRGNANGDK